MKKHKNMLIKILMCIFLVQSMSIQTNISVDAMATLGVPYIVAYYKETTEKIGAAGVGLTGLTLGLWLDNKIAQIIEESTQKDSQFIEQAQAELQKAEKLKEEIDTISQAIDIRISQLLAEEYIPKLELFCTNKSKIFVLKNIQDFFEFNLDEKYALFNSLVYEVCIKKIKQLEKEEVSDLEKGIDSARGDYIDYYEVSVEQLHNMTLAMVGEKINIIRQEIDRLGKKYTDENASQNNINCLALISIFGHLKYIKEYKFKENYKGYRRRHIFEQEEGDKNVEIMEKALHQKKAYMEALRALPARKKNVIPYTQEEVMMQQLKMQNMEESTPRSIFSRIRAYFVSWFK